MLTSTATILEVLEREGDSRLGLGPELELEDDDVRAEDEEVDVLEVGLEDVSELDVVDSSAVTVTTSVVKMGNGESIEDSILPIS